MDPKENKRSLWKDVDYDEYQRHVTISTIGSTTESAEEIDDKIVYMEDLEKRKQVYGICGECTEFLNEIKTHLQIYLLDIIQCYGITQDPNTKDYMMIKLNRTSEKRSNNIQTHPQAIYTSRLLNFKNLPEPVNSDITKTTLHSECFDCQLDELDLDEINQDEENNTE
ncbi:unnamed protein product [Rhizophagus irregularis]|uniref:Uncharacterized protein n=1 Tax=Rhizophagus irregularis TaxID=588596 RepID=A0A915ZU29_9GLOM|nr:unnamed protein product [Rhizophagus irregularis]